jgi:hypothetical protein
MLGDQAAKILKEIMRVVRTGTGFGVKLNREAWIAPALQARHGVVVQIPVGDGHFGGVE